jgi:hypothetical protein
MFQLKNLESPYLDKSDFVNKLKVFKAKLDDKLIEQYITACTDENNRLNVHLMANHYLHRHPYTPKAAFKSPKKLKLWWIMMEIQ